MEAPRINCIEAVIERIEKVLAAEEADREYTLNTLSKAINVDRKTLRKWISAGIVRAKQGKKFVSLVKDSRQIKFVTRPNGIHRIVLPELLEDLTLHRSKQKDLL